MANFEAFCRDISSSINLSFLKSERACPIPTLNDTERCSTENSRVNVTPRLLSVVFVNAIYYIATLICKWINSAIKIVGTHSSEIRCLCLMKCSSKAIQNLLYF